MCSAAAPPAPPLSATSPRFRPCSARSLAAERPARCRNALLSCRLLPWRGRGCSSLLCGPRRAACPPCACPHCRSSCRRRSSWACGCLPRPPASPPFLRRRWATSARHLAAAPPRPRCPPLDGRRPHQRTRKQRPQRRRQPSWNEARCPCPPNSLKPTSPQRHLTQCTCGPLCSAVLTVLQLFFLGAVSLSIPRSVCPLFLNPRVTTPVMHPPPVPCLPRPSAHTHWPPRGPAQDVPHHASSAPLPSLKPAAPAQRPFPVSRPTPLVTLACLPPLTSPCIPHVHASHHYSVHPFTPASPCCSRRPPKPRLHTAAAPHAARTAHFFFSWAPFLSCMHMCCAFLSASLLVDDFEVFTCLTQWRMPPF